MEKVQMKAEKKTNVISLHNSLYRMGYLKWSNILQILMMKSVKLSIFCIIETKTLFPAKLIKNKG